MSLASLTRALPEGQRVLLDASALIAYLDGHDAVTPVIAHVLDEFVYSGRNPAVVSMVTVSEILVRPLRLGVGDAYDHTLDFLARYPHLKAGSIGLAVAQEAASLRASHRLKAPDALTVATGLLQQVGFLVTNDNAWATKLQPISARIRVLLLSKHLPFP